MPFCRTGEYRTVKSPELGATALEMPYRGDRLSMVFFLPDKAEEFLQMENKFGDFDFSSLAAKGHKIKFDLSIPRFKLETSHSLNEPLAALGMGKMFQGASADFSGVSGKKDLYVSAVMQKAFVEVNEEGTEAAAATGGVMMMRMAMITPRFALDRPFLFAIVDNLTGMVLFTGRVTNPNEN